MSNGILQFSLILRFVNGKSNLEHHCFKSTRLEKNWFYKIFLNLFTGDAKSFCSCASGIRIIKKSLSGLETSIKLNDRPIDWMHRNKILLIFTIFLFDGKFFDFAFEKYVLMVIHFQSSIDCCFYAFALLFS